MKSKIISTTLVLVGFVIGASALSALAGVWTPPTQSPPYGNVDAPINVGDFGQVKTGSLTVGGLGVLGSFAFKPVGGAPPTSGQVLMADDSDLPNGKVKWGTLPAVGGGGSGGIEYSTLRTIIIGGHPSSYPAGSELIDDTDTRCGEDVGVALSYATARCGVDGYISAQPTQVLFCGNRKYTPSTGYTDSTNHEYSGAALTYKCAR